MCMALEEALVALSTLISHATCVHGNQLGHNLLCNDHHKLGNYCFVG